MSFIVTVIEGDEPFTIDFGSTVQEAFDLIRQSYPDINGRFRVITKENEKEIPRDLKPTDSFPANDSNIRVVFIPARQVSPQQGGQSQAGHLTSVNLLPVRVFGDGTKPNSTAIIIGRRTVLACEHSLKVNKTLNEQGTAVDESYETDYWIQLKTERGPRGGYTSEGRIKLKLYKCHVENDWALLYRISGTFNDDEIAELDRTAVTMNKEEYFNVVRGKMGSLLHCPVRHLQNTSYANELVLVAFNSDVRIQSANFRHVHYSGHELAPGSSGGGLFVDGKLIGMNQVQVHDEFDEEAEITPKEFCYEDGTPLPINKIESPVRANSEDKAYNSEIREPSAKKMKSDSETTASRGINTAVLNSAIILCRCRKLMTYFQEIEDDAFRG